MKKKSNILIYMILVSAVLLTKVLGLVRGMMLSAYYGTGIEAEAFTAVSNLPLIIFDVTFGTAISSAFVPVFNEKLSKNGDKTANRFASNFFNIVLLFSFVIILLGIAFPKTAVMFVASGFSGQAEKLTLASQLMRIIMPIMSFACCTFIFIGILQSYGEFIAPALVSLFSNLSMIVYLAVFNKSLGIRGLAVAFCFGWFLQLAFLIPFLKKKKFKYSFCVDFKSPDIKKVAILTLPLFVSALAQPINQLISSNLSSTISNNGYTTVNYAYYAYFIVAGVFSYALTNMFFPEMSRKFVKNDVAGATIICKDMLSAITAIIMPIMAFLCACATPVIKILYERGEFSANDTVNVAALLSIYSLGMIFLSWQDILNKYFYSMQKSYIPMISSGAGIATNLILSFILTPFMELSGLAVSTVISGIVMTAILCTFTLKFSKQIFIRKFVLELAKLLLSGAMVFGICKLILQAVDFNASLTVLILFVIIILIVSLVVYLVMLLILKSENLITIKKLLKKEDKSDVI